MPLFVTCFSQTLSCLSSYQTVKEKIEIICKEIYGADGVDYSELAEKQIKQYEEAGFGKMPICIAKTQYSFSCDATAKGVPTGFRVPVREIRSCAGAGFLYPLAGGRFIFVQTTLVFCVNPNNTHQLSCSKTQKFKPSPVSRLVQGLWTWILTLKQELCWDFSRLGLAIRKVL